MLSHSALNSILYWCLGILVVLVPAMLYAVWLQKKAMGVQGSAIGRMNRSLELQELSAIRADELLAAQRETNALLRELVDATAKRNVM